MATRLAAIMKNNESVNLDVLRSLAIIFVVFSHLPILNSLFESGAYHVQALGLLGVLIFFVHTCLVLMHSLERQTEKYGEDRRAWLFFIRRAFRIYPLSIAVVLVLCIVAPLYSATPPDWQRTVSNLLLIQNLTGHASIPGALWTLPFEVQMYLILPALLIFVNRSGETAPRYVGILWLGAVGLVLISWRIGLNYHLIKYIPCFLPGVLAFTLRKSPRTLSPWMLLLYIGAIAVLFPLATAHSRNVTLKEHVLAWPVCLILGLIIPKCREIDSDYIRKAGKVVARYSYGAYLVHGTCIAWAFGHSFAGLHILQWIVFIGSTTGLSYLAYHLIEKPGIELGERLAMRASKALTAQRALKAG